MIYWLTIIFIFIESVLFAWIPSPAASLQEYWGKQAVVQGRIDPLSVKVNNEGISTVLQCEKMSIEGETLPYDKKLRVFVHKETEAERLQGTLQVVGVLQPLTCFTNPGSFDGEQWQKVNGIGGRLSKARVECLDKKLGLREKLTWYNYGLRQRLSRSLPQQEASLLGGMLLGGSGELAEEDRELFSRLGLAHLLSVSGTHIVLWTGLLKLFLGFVRSRWRNYLIMACLGIYAILCGCRPPVVRALGMSALILWGQGTGDRRKSLCLLAMLLLAFNPLWLGDIGFQLSFGAAVGLVCLLQKCQQLWQNLLPEQCSFVGEALAVTMAAQLPVVPLEIAYFHQLSLISILSNLLLVPVLELATIMTVPGLLLQSITGNTFIVETAAWLVRQVLREAEILNLVPGAVIVVGNIPVWTGIIYATILILWADFGTVAFLRNRERNWGLAGGCLLLLAIYGYMHWLPGNLRIYFLDVGQGDATVIVTPKHEILVVDTGGLKGYDTGARIVAPFIRSLGQSRIDYLLLSHSDYDHIGGARGLVRNIAVKNIVLPYQSYSREEAAMVNGIIDQTAQTKVKEAKDLERIKIAGGALERLQTFDQAQKGNAASTVWILVDNFSNKALFVGDLPTEGEEQLLKNYNNDLKKNSTSILENCDILKVGHHGSQGSSSTKFLNVVRPRLAVISCGLNNRYGHPHQETLRRLRESGSEIVRTDKEGCVKVEFNRKGISWTGTK